MATVARHDRPGGIALEPSAGQCAVAGSATGALAATDPSVDSRAQQQ
jgi:hypothetical protein